MKLEIIEKGTREVLGVVINDRGDVIKMARKTGDKVMIKNRNGRDEVFDEGMATLRRPLQVDREPELWKVEFDDEPGMWFPRFIY